MAISYLNRKRRQVSQKYARRSFLGVEGLEQRTVLAGNIVAAVGGGHLRLFGDAADNQIEVTRTGTSSVVITSLDGSTTINGQTGPVTLNNVSRGIIASLGDGDDVLELSGSSTASFQLNGHSTINTGNGDDVVRFTNVSMLGNLSLSTGAGADQVFADADDAVASSVGLQVRGTAVIHTGTENDVVSLQNSSFSQNLILDASGGDDIVDIEDSTFGRLVNLFGGAGNDRLTNVGNTFTRSPYITSFETRGSTAGPTVSNDTATVAEGGSVIINVLANDVAAAGTTINTSTVVITQAPAHGTAVANANGTITYTNNGTEFTSDSFRYTVRDSAGNLSNEAIVTVAVTAVNDAPTIAPVANVTLAEDTASTPITITLVDPDTAASNLTLTATSSNTAVVAANGIAITGTGATRTLVITPVANATGTSTITLTVSDGTSTSTRTFTVTVTAQNDAPTISNVNDIAVAAGATIAPITLTLADQDTAAANLTVTGTSSNQAVIANSGIQITGAGATRTVTLTPVANATGITTITLTVIDGAGGTATETFKVAIGAGSVPTITAIADQTINEDSATTALAFQVNDAETAAGSLQVSATSSNTALVPLSGIAISGTGSNRTVTVTPTANATGTSTITLTVTDAAGLSTTETFLVTVNPANDAPVVVGENVTINSNQTSPVTLNVLANDTDVDGPNPLTVSGVTGGQVGQTFNGTYGTIRVNANGSLTYTLNPDAVDDLLAGSMVEELITYLVSDGATTSSGVVDIDIRVV
jgi:hypothetical protein